MTLRTTSATRRSVVSRSSDVARTSATSSRSGSICKCGLLRTEPIAFYIHDTSHFRGYLSRFTCGVSVPLLPRHDANVGKIAVALGIVEPVAYDKLVGNLETDVVAFQCEFAPRRLVQKRRNLQRLGLARQQHLLQISHR